MLKILLLTNGILSLRAKNYHACNLLLPLLLIPIIPQKHITCNKVNISMK